MHLTLFYRLGHPCAKNYQSWWKFYEVLTKTILLSFFFWGGGHRIVETDKIAASLRLVVVVCRAHCRWT